MFIFFFFCFSPFFGAEFQGEIPKKFRFLSFYVYEVGNKNKVRGINVFTIFCGIEIDIHLETD